MEPTNCILLTVLRPIIHEEGPRTSVNRQQSRSKGMVEQGTKDTVKTVRSSPEHVQENQRIFRAQLDQLIKFARILEPYQDVQALK